MSTHAPFIVLLSGPSGSGRTQTAIQIAHSALARGEDVLVLGGRSARASYAALEPYTEQAFTLPEAVAALKRLVRRSQSRPVTLVLDEGLGLLRAVVPPAVRGLEDVLEEGRALTAAGHRLLLQALDRQRISLAAVTSSPHAIDPLLLAQVDGLMEHTAHRQSILTAA